MQRQNSDQRSELLRLSAARMRHRDTRRKWFVLGGVDSNPKSLDSWMSLLTPNSPQICAPHGCGDPWFSPTQPLRLHVRDKKYFLSVSPGPIRMCADNKGLGFWGAVRLHRGRLVELRAESHEDTFWSLSKLQLTNNGRARAVECGPGRMRMAFEAQHMVTAHRL